VAISDDIRLRVREANDIAETIARYVPLKKAGRNFKACCPFHNEKTPSFHVNAERQTFKCFGCNEGGSVFDFVMKMERLTFVEALRMLAERAGITVEDDPAAAEKRRIRDLAFRAPALGRQRLRARPSASGGARASRLCPRPRDFGSVDLRVSHRLCGRRVDDARRSRCAGWCPGEASKPGLVVPRQDGSGVYDPIQEIDSSFRFSTRSARHRIRRPLARRVRSRST
jgi:DNA primase